MRVPEARQPFVAGCPEPVLGLSKDSPFFGLITENFLITRLRDARPMRLISTVLHSLIKDVWRVVVHVDGGLSLPHP
jgi:hypothetical protein